MNIKKCGLILGIMTCLMVGFSSGDFINDPLGANSYEPFSFDFGSDYEPFSFDFGSDITPFSFDFGSDYEPLDLSSYFGFEPYKWTPDEAPLVMPSTLPSKEDLIAYYRNN